MILVTDSIYFQKKCILVLLNNLIIFNIFEHFN